MRKRFGWPTLANGEHYSGGLGDCNKVGIAREFVGRCHLGCKDLLPKFRSGFIIESVMQVYCPVVDSKQRPMSWASWAEFPEAETRFCCGQAGN